MEITCFKCKEELEEINPGIDGLYINSPDNYFEDSFIAREYRCTNRKCSHYKKKIEVFWDFTRVEVEGEEIEEE